MHVGILDPSAFVDPEYYCGVTSLPGPILMFWCYVTIVSLGRKLYVLGPKIESCDWQVSAARMLTGDLNLLGLLGPVLPVICDLADGVTRAQCPITSPHGRTPRHRSHVFQRVGLARAPHRRTSSAHAVHFSLLCVSGFPGACI